MANILAEKESLEDIADAIRAKTSTTNKYLPSEMAQAISTINTSDAYGIETIADAQNVVQGTFDRYGNVVEKDNRLRTSNYIQVSSGDTLEFVPGTNAQQFLYGQFSGEGTGYTADSAWYSGDKFIPISFNGYIIACFRRQDNSALNVADLDAVVNRISPKSTT